MKIQSCDTSYEHENISGNSLLQKFMKQIFLPPKWRSGFTHSNLHNLIRVHLFLTLFYIHIYFFFIYIFHNLASPILSFISSIIVYLKLSKKSYLQARITSVNITALFNFYWSVCTFRSCILTHLFVS
jgi:hypothetical protein